MARPTKEINPIRGKRLKQIITEEHTTQKALNKATGISQQAISEMINGKANVTDTTAEAVLKVYPHYRYEWLMGLDDFKTVGEQFSGAINEMNQEGEMLMRGLCSFANLSGFAISFTSSAFQHGHTDSIDNVMKWIRDGYTISRNGQTAQLSIEDFNDLEEEICDYVELRLDRIIQKQNRKKGEKSNG